MIHSFIWKAELQGYGVRGRGLPYTGLLVYSWKDNLSLFLFPINLFLWGKIVHTDFCRKSFFFKFSLILVVIYFTIKQWFLINRVYLFIYLKEELKRRESKRKGIWETMRWSVCWWLPRTHRNLVGSHWRWGSISPSRSHTPPTKTWVVGVTFTTSQAH